MRYPESVRRDPTLPGGSAATEHRPNKGRINHGTRDLSTGSSWPAGRRFGASSLSAVEGREDNSPHADTAVRPLPPTGAAVSASPRKLVRRANDALQQLVETLERYPEARRELVAKLGEQQTEELLQAARIVAAAARALPPERAPDSGVGE
jgi:hypothetical protein